MSNVNEGRTHEVGDQRARPGFEERQTIGLKEYTDVLGREWWIPLLMALVASVVVFWQQTGQPVTYTAEVLFQQQQERAPLEAYSAGFSGVVPPEIAATQIEILTSRAVLAYVVDSLNLRVEITPESARGAILDVVEVTPDAPTVDYRLELVEGRVQLMVDDSDEVVTALAPTGWMLAPGLRLHVAEGVDLTTALQDPVFVTVEHRDDVMKTIAGDLDLVPIRGTALMRVRFSSPDPQMAADVLNTLAASFEAYSARRARRKATRSREFLGTQLLDVADSLAVEQDRLALYQEDSQTIDPQLQGGTLARALMEAETELRSLRFQTSVLSSLVRSLQAGPEQDATYERMLALGSTLIPAGGAMYERLQDLRAERSRLTASQFGLTAMNPAVEPLDSLIAQTQAEMRSVAEQGLRVAGDRVSDAQALVDEISQAVGELPARAAVFARLQQRVDAAQNIFDLLAGRYYESQITEAVEAGDVELIDPAIVPRRADPSYTVWLVLFGAMGGLSVGLGTVLVREHLDNSVRYSHQAEEATGLPIVGTIPVIVAGQTGARMVFGSEGSQELVGAEAFRMLRTNLRFVQAGEPRILCVTSPGPADGKSTIAMNLSVALADQGANVLLVDGDLRRPSLHELFDVPGDPGLTEFLTNQITLVDALKPSGHDRLSILTSGHQVHNPSELLGGDGFRQLLVSARKTFDAIIIDSPPVLLVADAGVISREVDGTLLVARLNHTDRSALKLAADNLKDLGVPLTGLIVTFSEAPSGYGYYYYTRPRTATRRYAKILGRQRTK